MNRAQEENELGRDIELTPREERRVALFMLFLLALAVAGFFLL